MKALPLVLCYVVFPMSAIAIRMNSSELFRSWIDIAWVLLAMVCAVLLPLGRGRVS